MSKGVNPQFFDDKFHPSDVMQDYLPVFHSCDAYVFRTILSEKKLAPSICTFFENEKLLYLFYGRPAYKSSNNISSGLHSLLPVSFILRPESIVEIKRIAPFDTGAFNLGLYKDYLHSNMNINSFFLTPNKHAISKTVSYFFETNEKYFFSKPKETLKYDAMEFEIESYYNLIKGVGQTRVDDRKSSIEIQLENGIELNTDTVEAIIIPEHFTSSKIIQDIGKNDLKATIITYESYGIPSDHYYSEVLSLTRKYLQEKKYLHGSKSAL